MEKARVHLRVWAPKREREYSDSFIKELRRLDQPTGVEILKTLKRGKGYVRGTRGNSLTIEVVLQNLEGTRTVTARTLVDSGSTGSCIDRRFIEEHGLTTHRSPITVTVYNADGTVNKCGKITEYVEARMTVGEHAERVHFGVVQLGNADVFLGHDWLAHHNPSIHWADGTLSFDRCPGQCGFTEEDLERMQPKDEAQKWLSSIVDEEPWWEAHKAKRYFDKFRELFSERGFDRLPKR